MPYNPGAQQEAVSNYIGALTDDERKTAAYNALVKAHGPAIAYSPENALNAASADAAIPNAPAMAAANLANTQAEAPLKQAQTATAQANATGLQQTNDVNTAIRGIAMLGAIKNPDGSIPADEARHIVSNPVYQIDPAHVEPLVQQLSQPGGATLLSNMEQALRSGGKVEGGQTVVTNPDGTTSLVRSTSGGGVVETNLGGAKTTQQQSVPIKQQNADTAAKKVPIAQQNANANTFRAGTQANNSQFGNPSGAAPGAAAAPAQGSGTPAIDPASQFARLPPKGKQAAIGQATQIVNSGTQLATSNQILDQVDKQISPFTAGTGSLLKDLPGSAQADLKANLKTLSAQGLTAWIQSLKNSQGQTGVGRVLQSEANAAMTLFGNMEQDQSAKQLKFHAQLFRQTVNSLYQHQQQAFQSMYGVAPHVAAGTDDPMAPKQQFAPQDIVNELRRRGVVK